MQAPLQSLDQILQEKAHGFGWAEVEVIDDDLGVSASGTAERPGFERLLARVCEGTVGAVFAVEASRLARNGREWHTLLELCGFMETLIIDHDGVYDPICPRVPNQPGRGSFCMPTLGHFPRRFASKSRPV